MKAELKNLYSLDIDESLKCFRPTDEYFFGLNVRLMVGENGIEGEESFDLIVCSPDWIKAQYENSGWVWGRHMLILLKYDYELMISQIKKYINSISGESWEDIALQVSRIALWEFEDYQERD